ncbi:MAG: hypothetical protein AAFY34_13140 [Pseudomonadota bacterium]
MTVIPLRHSFAQPFDIQQDPNLIPSRRIIPMTTRGTNRNDWLLGAATVSAVLAVAMAACFNGGLSVKTGDMEMTLSASLSQGLNLTFVSVSS